jgi:hypothetical protein
MYNKKNINYIFFNENMNCLFFNNLNFKFICLQNILLNAGDYNMNLISLKNFKSNKYNKNYYVYYNLGSNNKEISYNYNNLIIYQGAVADINIYNSNIILPATLFIEKTTSFFNFFGLYQKLNLILSKIKDSKDD